MTDLKSIKRKATGRATRVAQPPRLGKDVQTRIGDKLRAMYAEIVDEGVPEHFATLLRQIDDEPNGKDK